MLRFIEPVYVSDVQAQLLDSDESVPIRYNTLHYHSLLKKYIADLHIPLRDDRGEAIKFETGNVILTLLKKNSFTYKT